LVGEIRRVGGVMKGKHVAVGVVGGVLD
jgi:hypothetical protein